MLEPGTRVGSTTSDLFGTVASDDGTTAYVCWDDAPSVTMTGPSSELVRVQGKPAPSDSADPIHAYYLTHARNAGAAVEALRIIRDETRKVLGHLPAVPQDDSWDALKFIDGFTADVLKQVLPE